ncbi:GNAT family N-acetyltransferase [Kitasatospora acidiphila]|uniref:GNAT family N-acetyltransferase n=1 Tax=Kitasatospora acidiphila TaxID=2567942 RepID=A0A540W0W7_9ACTN|nr:GNAT family N-acetyltransferase [Kitasatospora acidiphila]TQF02651.1 GNAT family N-acetyltransferase [Kitasatospora acidiphila]
MTTALTEPTPRVPDGYAVGAEEADGIIHVRVRTTEGDVAAAGYATVTDGVAVMDRVATYPEHQRRGLGTLVMDTLAATAVERGAHTAVLGATDEGRALYESLGWTLLAPLGGLRPPALRRGPASLHSEWIRTLRHRSAVDRCGTCKCTTAQEIRRAGTTSGVGHMPELTWAISRTPSRSIATETVQNECGCVCRIGQAVTLTP